MIYTTIYYLNILILVYFLIVNFVYTMLLLASLKNIFRTFDEMRHGEIRTLIDPIYKLPVTAILPMYNEESFVENTVRGLLTVKYDKIKIVIVNDGSTDNTFEKLKEMLQLEMVVPAVPQHIKTEAVINYYSSKLHPDVFVIDKLFGGKADALNAGINVVKTPLFFSMDADTIFEPESIDLLVFSFLSHPHTIAEGGSVYILNGCKVKDGIIIEKKMSYRPLISLQITEYLRAFVFGRQGLKWIGGPLILPGAFTLFEREAVLQIQGYKKNTVGEDLEIILELHRYMAENEFPYRISYNVSSSVWTEVPNTLDSIWSQRLRWHQGLMESLFSHLNMMFNPKYKKAGMLAFPVEFFIELISPLVELLGYVLIIVSYFLNILFFKFMILFFIAAWGLSLIITLATALINFATFNKYRRIRDIFWIVVVVFIEYLGFRQLLAVCRTYAIIKTTFRLIFTRNKNREKEKGWNVDRNK